MAIENLSPRRDRELDTYNKRRENVIVALFGKSEWKERRYIFHTICHYYEERVNNNLLYLLALVLLILWGIVICNKRPYE